MTAFQAANEHETAPATVAGIFTTHAIKRVRQRGIGLPALDCLLRYGREDHDHHGAQILTFDALSLDEVRRNEPRQIWQQVVDARALYAVVDSTGTVITAGHRFRRIARDVSLSSARRRRTRVWC
jgi:hypothetical protein